MLIHYRILKNQQLIFTEDWIPLFFFMAKEVWSLSKFCFRGVTRKSIGSENDVQFLSKYFCWIVLCEKINCLVVWFYEWQLLENKKWNSHLSFHDSETRTINFLNITYNHTKTIIFRFAFILLCMSWKVSKLIKHLFLEHVFQSLRNSHYIAQL